MFAAAVTLFLPGPSLLLLLGVLCVWLNTVVVRLAHCGVNPPDGTFSALRALVLELCLVGKTIRAHTMGAGRRSGQAPMTVNDKQNNNNKKTWPPLPCTAHHKPHGVLIFLLPPSSLCVHAPFFLLHHHNLIVVCWYTHTPQPLASYSLIFIAAWPRLTRTEKKKKECQPADRQEEKDQIK